VTSTTSESSEPVVPWTSPRATTDSFVERRGSIAEAFAPVSTSARSGGSSGP